MIARLLAAAAILALVSAALTGCSAPPRLSLRLWDPAAAAAYRTSLATFEERTGVAVDVVVVPWADYWTQLRADVSAGTVDDVFWTNSANLLPYAEAGVLLPVPPAQRAAQGEGWAPGVVAQSTADGELWGVPQLTDPGIGLIYNLDLLEAAGLTASDVAALSWDPDAPDDPLRRVARALTVDAAGRHPSEPGFDPSRTRVYGYSASNDLNAILLQFLAGNGSAWQSGDRFVFADPAGIETFAYLARLINEDRVAPSTADTAPPAGGDFARDQFVQGRLALLQTGAYSLPQIAENADFAWGIAPIPSGPAGRSSVTNGIVAAASARSDDPGGQRELMEWLGSPDGLAPLGASGAALPAALAAQPAYAAYWRQRGVDISPMLDVLAGGRVQPPQGARYPEAEAALQPILNDVLAGRLPVADGVRAAQRAANRAAGH